MFIGRGEKAAKTARALLRNSGVVICPAFTIYGFSASLFDFKANLKIYEIKKREKRKPFIVIGSKDFIKSVSLDVDSKVLDFLLDNAITVITKTKIELPFYASINGKTAFRIANTAVLKELTSTFPITSTSVNISNSKEIVSIIQMFKLFSRKVDYLVVDDVVGVPSTIVEIDGKVVKLLREGFNIEKIKEVIDG